MNHLTIKNQVGTIDQPHILDNKAPSQIHVEVCKYQGKNKWILTVKAQGDYKIAGLFPKEFTINLKGGKNLITHPNSSSETKEYLKMYSDHLTYCTKYKGIEANHERFFFKPLEIRGMWQIWGFKTSEKEKMIWWLWERKKYEEAGN